MTTSLPDAVVGESYKASLHAVRGTAPLTWSVIPSLPIELAFDTSGTISGKPTSASEKKSYAFTVKDSGVPPASATAELTFEVKASISSPASHANLPAGHNETASTGHAVGAK